MINVYERVASNKRKSWFIVTLFFAFVTLAAYVIARALGYGPGVFGIAMIISGISSFIGYYYSDRIVLSMSGVKPANRRDHFNFYTAAENLSQVAGIPVPKLYVIEDTAMNAFATGRDPEHAAVVATTGLLSRLNRTQIEGVVAYELSHVANYDIRLMSTVTVLVGLVALLADWFLRASAWGGGRRRDNDNNGGQIQALFMILGLVMALLAPLIAQLIQLAISRSREFLADASAAKITRYPEGLAQALEIIAADHEPLETANKATAHMYITNPFHMDAASPSKLRRSGVGWFANLFNTHPPVEQRIQALRS